MPDGARPQGDEHRGGELEQQADPDRQPLDRDEVEPLHGREADDAVEREQRELVARDAQLARRRQEQERGEARRTPRSRGAASARSVVIELPVRITFETVPLTAKSTAAATAIA